MRDTLLFVGLCGLFVVLAYAFFPATAGTSEAEPDRVETVDGFNETEIRHLTFVEQNEARRSASVSSVERDKSVDDVAQAWAKEMAKTGVYIHGNFEQRMLENTDCETYGEVIANPTLLDDMQGFSTGESYYIDSDQEAARRLVNGWMNSTQHKTILADEGFTHVGIGISITDDGRLYAVMDYCAY